MKRAVMLMALALLVGCQKGGPKGDKGDPGNVGPSAIPGGRIITYSGTIVPPSNAASVDIPDLNVERGDIVNVYMHVHTGGGQFWQQITNNTGSTTGSYQISDRHIILTIGTNITTDWLINILIEE